MVWFRFSSPLQVTRSPVAGATPCKCHRDMAARTFSLIQYIPPVRIFFLLIMVSVDTFSSTLSWEGVIPMSFKSAAFCQ